MHFLKNFFLSLILLCCLCILALVCYRHFLLPTHCLSDKIDLHHTDYVKCGPIVAQDLLVRAQNKDVQAAYKLALMYDAGDRIPENRKQAIYWLQKAEQANLPEAQYVMAVWAERGYFGEAGDDLAVPLYEAAARQGHLNAMKSLANIFRGIDETKYNYWMAKIRKER